MFFSFDREKAEQTIWNRLKHLTALKKRCQKHKPLLKIGVLGNYYDSSSLFSSAREKSVNVHARGSTERSSAGFCPANMLSGKKFKLLCSNIFRIRCIRVVGRDAVPALIGQVTVPSTSCQALMHVSYVLL